MVGLMYGKIFLCLWTAQLHGIRCAKRWSAVLLMIQAKITMATGTTPYDAAKYREGDTGPYMNEATWVDGNNIRHYSPHALLRVHNRNDNGQVTVFVTSQWDDQNNQDGLRPDSVTVKLFRDGIETGLTLTLSESNNWSGDFGDLKKYENGVVHQYTIKADAVDEYDSTIMGDMTSGFLVLNRHTQKTVTVAGSKFWENDAGKENLRPEFIVINLLADGQKVAGRVVQPDADGQWTWSFSDMPQYQNGKGIIYSITENPVKDYMTQIDGYNVMNIYRPSDILDPDQSNPSSPSDPDKPGTSDNSKIPETGDNRIPIQLLAFVLALSEVSLSILLYKRKGKRHL